MKAEETPRDDSRWPGWLEPLRPDDVTRRRVRQAVMERARPVLAERRPAGAWEVTAGWADVLVPVAAVASVLFTVVALQTGGEAPGPAAGAPLADDRQGVRIEELLAEPGTADPPALLTRRSRPDLDGVLEATLSHSGER